MKVYIDVNVLVDFAIGREPFGLEVAEMITAARMKKFDLVTAPNSYVIAFFQARKRKLTSTYAKHSLTMIRNLIDCVQMNGLIIDAALRRPIPSDLEDGVQIEAAIASNANIFISNDRQLIKTRVSGLKLMSTRQFISEYTPI